MRVLIIKTSSLGDIVHTLPALSDAQKAIPGIEFDWVVEEAFASIPAWHSAVNEVIPVALRRWRRALFASATRQQWRSFKQHLQAKQYDRVIDAQGLLKSAWLTAKANGPSHGYDRQSAREGLVASTYQVKHRVARDQHAIDRVRALFAAALGYPLPAGLPDYGIARNRANIDAAQLVFLHGTTWPSKHWPEQYWRQLAEIAATAGYRVVLPSGNAEERARAQHLAENNDPVQAAAAMDLEELANLLASSAGAVAVDTGLGHLAAALALPTVSLYGSTDPALTGTHGQYQAQLAAEFDCAPCLQRQCSYNKPAAVSPACYQSLQPQQVWDKLQQLVQEKEGNK